MRSRLSAITAGASVAIAAALLGAPSAQAGQAGSITSITGGTVYQGGGTVTTTTLGGSASGISITKTDNSIVSVPTSSVNSTKVTLSLEVSDDGYHGYSPANNSATFTGASISNTATIGANAPSTGITSVQQTIGNASVSVSANALLDGSALSTLAGKSTFSPAGETAALVLNPAFAISNSALAARVLAIEAMSGAIKAAGTAGVVAIDLTAKNTYEMSPESNVAMFTGGLSNVVNLDQSTGITQVQQQIGNANVQTSFNTIVFSPTATGTLPGWHP